MNLANKFFTCLYIGAASSLAYAGADPVGNTGILVDFAPASITGSGRTITATSVPVTMNGQTSYYNLQFDVNENSSGVAANLMSATVASGPVATLSNTLNFVPGVYKPDSSYSNYCTYTLSQPTIGASGVKIYTLTANTNGTCTSFSKTFAFGVGNIRANQVLGTQSEAFYQAARPDFAYGQFSNSGSFIYGASQLGSVLSLTWIRSDGTSGSIENTFIKQ